MLCHQENDKQHKQEKKDHKNAVYKKLDIKRQQNGSNAAAYHMSYKTAR